MKKGVIILFLILTTIFCDKVFTQEKNDLNIALIYPHLTKEVLYKDDNSFNPTDSWELFFMTNNYKYKLLNDDELGDIRNDINVVVIPSMEVVNEEIIENIETIFDDRKGVLITGNFAQFDDEGNYVKQDYQKRITGFQISRLSMGNGISINHSLNGCTPLSIGLKPGQKILLHRKPLLCYSYDLSADNTVLGNYLQAAGEFTGIVNYLQLNKRLLWYGFSFDQLIDENQNRFISNSLNWLSSTPVAFINYWPGNYLSACIMYKNIENPNDIYTDFLTGTGSYELNYFILPGILDNPGFDFKKLGTRDNINILWDDFYFSGMSSSELLNWLNITKSSINKYTDQKYCGVSSYGGFYNSLTYELLSTQGYSFIFSSGYSDSYSFDYDSTDKIYLLNQSASPGVGYLSRLDFILNAGGIGYINIDSLQDNIYSTLKNKKCWITDFSDILEWNERRKQLKLSIYFVKSNSYEITVKNTGISDVADTGIWISIPDRTGNIKLENAQGVGEMTFDYEKKMYFLKISSLRAYQEASFRISVAM